MFPLSWVFNWHNVTGAVLQSPLSFNSFIQWFSRSWLVKISSKILSIRNRKSWGAEILRECSECSECSRPTLCHMSRVTCNVFLWRGGQSGGASWGESVINGAYPVPIVVLSLKPPILGRCSGTYMLHTGFSRSPYYTSSSKSIQQQKIRGGGQ